MHPMNAVRTGLLVLLGLLVSGAAVGQEPPPRPEAPARNVGTITLPIGGSQQLTMRTKKRIANVFLSGDGVAQVAGSVKPDEVVIRGLAAGAVRLELTDVDGNKEVYEIIVQFDVQYLKSTFSRAVPSSNVDVIPMQNRTLILTGWVEKAEDVNIVLEVARSSLGGTATGVVNALKVGGVMQVQLDVTVASVNRTSARRRGFNMTINGTTFSGGSILGGLTSPGQQTQVPVPPNGVSISGLGLAPVPPPTGANLIFGIVPANIQILIQLLKDESLAKVLAEPKVVTLSGRPAHFLSGGQQAVLSAASGINGPGVEFRDVGTEIDVLPIVLGNGRIYLEVHPRFRAPNQAKGISTTFGFVTGFDEQSVRTSIEMEPGQTMAIGGLLQTSVAATSERIPVLGSLPYVGALFSTVFHQTEEDELVILVTPHLVDAQDCNQMSKRLPGRETRNPDDYELFLEGILEAPRGQRQVFENGKYKPPYKNDPTYRNMPCADPLPKQGRGKGGCASGDCGVAPERLPAAMNKAPAAPLVEGDGLSKPDAARELLPAPVPSRGNLNGAPLGIPVMPPAPGGDQP